VGSPLSLDGSISFRLKSGHGGRYEVFDEFAAGGIASVHLARYITANGVTKIVAVKKLHPHFAKDSAFRTALLDEARIVARIHHPNVVEMLDVCDDEEDLFLAMEYVHGVSLSRLLGQWKKPVLPAVAVAIASGALKGLHAAHEATTTAGKPLNIVHRDVSPQNLLVGVDGIPRVIDFGLAYALGRSHATQSGVVKGKPAYMAPEQIRGERATRASDIFSMAVTLWGALAGRKLFDGDVMEATLFKVLTDPIPKLRSVVPSLPEALDAAVMKGLERSPTERYATAAEFARALEAAMRPAMPAMVGDWVEQAGGNIVEKMNARLALVEAGHGYSQDPHDDGPTIKRQTPVEPISVDISMSIIESALKGRPTAPAVVEAAPVSPHVPSDPLRAMPTAPAAFRAQQPPSSSSSFPVALVLAGLALAAVGVGLGGWALGRRSSASEHAVPSASVTAIASAAVEVVPPATETANAEPVETAPAVDIDEGASPKGAAPPPKRTAGPPQVRKKAACTDPLNPKCN